MTERVSLGTQKAMKENDVTGINGGPSSLVYCTIALSSNVGPELKKQVSELHSEICPIPAKPTSQQRISSKHRTPQVLHAAQSARAEGDHHAGCLQADESTSQPNPTATEDTQPPHRLRQTWGQHIRAKVSYTNECSTIDFSRFQSDLA